MAFRFNEYNSSGKRRKGGWNKDDNKKYNGAKEGTFVSKKGGVGRPMIYVNAWNYSKRRGLVTIKAFENSKSVKSVSKKGNKFITMMFETFYKDSGNRVLEVGNYNVTSGKLYLQKTNMVLCTKEDWCVNFTKKKR